MQSFNEFILDLRESKVNPLINTIWKKINGDDRYAPASAKKTWAWSSEIARAVGKEQYDKFSLLDLSDDQLTKMASSMGMK